MRISRVTDSAYELTILNFDRRGTTVWQVISVLLHVGLVLVLVTPVPNLFRTDYQSRRPLAKVDLVFPNNLVPPTGALTKATAGSVNKVTGAHTPPGRIVRFADAPNMEILAELSRLNGLIGFGLGYEGEPVEFVKCFDYPEKQERDACGSTDDFTSLIIGSTEDIEELRSAHHIEPEFLTYALFPSDLRADINASAMKVNATDVTIHFLRSGGFITARTKRQN